MCKSLWFFLVCLVALAAIGWIASHHVVNTSQGLIVMNKRFLALQDSFANVRAWTYTDFSHHPQIKQALVQSGYADLVPGPTFAEQRAFMHQLAWDLVKDVQAAHRAMIGKTLEWIIELDAHLAVRTNPS